MRTVLLLIPLGAACCAGEAYGTWKLNPARSTFAGQTQPKTLVVRVEPRPKGEVVTVDRTGDKGQSTSSSTNLYLDGAARDFQGTDCSGSQTSRRLNSQTIEILQRCTSGDWERVVRRLTEGGRNWSWRSRGNAPAGARRSASYWKNSRLRGEPCVRRSLQT